MSRAQFTDFYEILQVSSNANSDTIDRIFRHLAQRYHPDNKETGDSELFQKAVEAHDTLRDPIKRTEYDILRGQVLGEHADLVSEAIGADRDETDEKSQEKLLVVLYVKCRQDIKNSGMGWFELVQMLDCPKEHMEFHIWYLKEKGWIRRTDEGLLAITAEGVDKVIENLKGKIATRRITDKSDHTIHL